MNDTGCTVGLLALVFVGAILTQPSEGHGLCARGFYVNGVRRDGRYECRKIPRERESEKALPYRPAPPEPNDEIHYASRIVCTNGTRAIVVDWQTVGCQPE